LALTGPTASDYSVVIQGSTFAVNQAPLTVNAPSASATFGEVPATFQPAYTGLVNGQTAPATPARCSSTATDTSASGKYRITCSVAADPNYSIGYGPPGTLTIGTAATKLTAAPASFGLLTVTFSATLTRADTLAPISGEPIAFSVAGQSVCRTKTDANGVAKCTVTPALVITLGPTTYTASFDGDADYGAQSASAQLSSGPITFGSAPGKTQGPVWRKAALLRVTVSRGGVVYATGTGRSTNGSVLFRLKPNRRASAGRYTVSITQRGSAYTIKRTITLR
jgi:hypothetical protein